MVINSPVQGLDRGHVIPVEADHVLEAPVEGSHEGPVLVTVWQTQAVAKLMRRRLQQICPCLAPQGPVLWNNIGINKTETVRTQF